MENEKKVNVTETKNVEVKENKIYVERESFKGNDGKEYWSYLLKGKVRGRDVKVDFAPKDKGGYEPLDILFDVQPKAELLMSKEEMTDSAGNKTKYTTYTLQTVDTDGTIYQCGVKPARDSDKALLGMLLNVLGKKA